MRWGLIAAAALLGGAGPSRADPDWPCVQRLVPVLTAGTFWPGPPPEGDWRANPRVAELVRQAAPRAVPQDAAVSQVLGFAEAVPPGERQSVLPLVFAGLVDETNAQRSTVIERLRDVNRRQRDIIVTVGRVNAELRALPQDAPAPEREEVTSRRAFLMRDYQEVERTIRYACEVPANLEQRLGAFAQALRSVLPPAP